MPLRPASRATQTLGKYEWRANLCAAALDRECVGVINLCSMKVCENVITSTQHKVYDSASVCVLHLTIKGLWNQVATCYQLWPLVTVPDDE